MLQLWDGASACLETHCLSDRHDLSVSTSRLSVKGATGLGLFRMVAICRYADVQPSPKLSRSSKYWPSGFAQLASAKCWSY